MFLSKFNPNIVYFPNKHLKGYLASIVHKLTSPNDLYTVQKSKKLYNLLNDTLIGRKEETFFIANQELWILDNTDRTDFLSYPYRRRLLSFYNANLKGVIKTQFSGNYDYPFKFYPFVYQCDYRLDCPKTLTRIRNFRTENYSSSIFARWDSRKDKRVIPRRLWAESCKNIPNIDIKDSGKAHLPWNMYMEKIATARFALSSNGRGQLCARDMEIAATGTPMLRERLEVQMYVPFNEGVHYIEVNHEDIAEKFAYYMNNYDKSAQIGLNSRNYFDQHTSTKGMQKIFQKIIAARNPAEI